MTEPENDFQAMVLALRLAITAPTEDQASECLKIAETLDLSEFEVERAKREALRQIEESD
tara:strand:+ start:1873 stop:2052 length:180 start_codon:yes stop_codon:yes gene_type:complete